MRWQVLSYRSTVHPFHIDQLSTGIGGGGIVSCVWVITAEIVPMRQRAKWSQALSVTWSCSAVAGPLLGGLFSSENRIAELSMNLKLNRVISR